MSQKVRIKTGFAGGLEGEAQPLASGWEVTVVYPEGFVYNNLGGDLEDLSGATETLYYDTGELEFLAPAE